MRRCDFYENITIDRAGAVYCHASSPTIEACTFHHNHAEGIGGAMVIEEGSSPHLISCTFHRNVGLHGCQITCGWNSGVPCRPVLENCILAFGEESVAFACVAGVCEPTLACCDIYGNEGGDWTGCIADQLGVDGNIRLDPLLCDAGNQDFTLEDCSPCTPFSPPNAECDLIGAHPVGCGGSPATSASWGRVKSLFRK
ncbi:MAG: hypothetical protein GF330_07185 [Candidatus Eisenbacteria bacterium]|nr:hypothetical protein [Candidatus Eisenbacteria bacterium]